MSTHSHNDHNVHPPGLHPEDSGIKPQPILMFLVILAVATAGAFVIIKGTLWAFAKLDPAMTPQPPATMMNTDQRKLPPEPRLQGAPGTGSAAGKDVPSELPLDEMKTYQTQIKTKSESYGWVNQQAGVAHIPIERAKSLIAEKGLPLREAGVAELEKAAEARKAVMNAGASAGRLIKKQ
jgi:hypothetical protein